jgi:hypothetical protein
MKYTQHTKTYRLEVEETSIREEDSGDTTKVMVYLQLQDMKDGLTSDTLASIVKTASQNMRGDYRIYHDPKGLVIVGRY